MLVIKRVCGSVRCVPAAVFCTWYTVRVHGAHRVLRTQGLFIAILTVGGVLKTVTDGKNLQNFLICVEMLPAALGMLYAFPYTEYKGAGALSAHLCRLQGRCKCSRPQHAQWPRNYTCMELCACRSHCKRRTAWCSRPHGRHWHREHACDVLCGSRS